MPAATQRDTEIEIMETRYRLGAGNTGEVTIRQRCRALTAHGRMALSKIQIPYVAAFDDVEFKSIKTLKKDGSVVAGDPASAFDVGPSGDSFAPQFTDSKLKTILLPNLETGDSIEYEALMRTRNWPKPGDFWFVHDLTTSAPVVSEKVVLDLPADRQFALYENSSVVGKTEIANGRRIATWITSNQEAAKPSPEGPAPLFAVSSITSWDRYGEWIHSLNHSAAEPTPEIAALAAKLTTGKSTEQERVAALYTYVATKVRYVSVSFGLGRLQPHAASTVLRNAYGDCKDQTALLSALLSAAGFKPHAVLTTPSVGLRVRDVPMPQFSHEFTAVETDAGLVFLDPSLGPVPPQLLPPGVRGQSALLVGDSTSSIIDIPMKSPVPTRVAATLKGKVTAAGVFEGSTRLEVQGLVERVLRRVFLDATEDDKEKVLSEMAGPEFRNANVRQISNSDPADFTKPFWVQGELSVKDFFSPSKTSMRITFELPNSPTELLEGMKKPDKPLPVEAFSSTRKMDLIVDPSFMITNQMPVHRKTAFGSFDSEFSYEHGHLLLARSFELNGTAIALADWNGFVEFLRAALTETAQGFTLARNGRLTNSTGLSALTQSMREGVAAYQSHDYEAAKRALLEATKLDPQNRSAWNNLGRAYAALHEYDKAEEAYKRQIEINPSDLYAYNNLGVVYRALKREDDAIAFFRKQIAVSPRDPYAHDNLSVAFAARNQWQEARKEAAIAVEVSPEDPIKWSRLGRAQVKTSQTEEAGWSFERALALVHDAMTENNIAYYMADGGFQLDKAWQLVSGTLGPESRRVCQPEILSRDDKCAPQLRRIAFMLDTAGWVLYRQGKLSEVEPYLSSSYAITPRAEVALHLSMILTKFGRIDESLKYFADALSRADFARVDSHEARRTLAEAVGGETQLDSRLERMQAATTSPGSIVHAIVLVDEHGRVLELQSADQAAQASLIGEAKSLTLLPISWPEHSIRSIRTIEFRWDGTKWSPNQSYVGQTTDLSATR
jgi:tetratricopeptide (TPR) repeat protein